MNTLSPYVDQVLAGKSINAAAKEAGVHPQTLRRVLLKHPDYASAKENGKLRPKGLEGVVPLDVEALKNDPAILEVLNGGLTTVVAEKYGLEQATLAARFHKAYPGHSLRRGARKNGVEAARAAVEQARRALERAEKALFDALTTPTP